MPLTHSYVWHVQIHRTGTGSIHAAIADFHRSGFTVVELPRAWDVWDDWKYSVHHSNKNAMTFHMLKTDACTFTVLAEFSNA